jgi:hypothetical protein
MSVDFSIFLFFYFSRSHEKEEGRDMGANKSGGGCAERREERRT